MQDNAMYSRPLLTSLDALEPLSNKQQPEIITLSYTHFYGKCLVLCARSVTLRSPILSGMHASISKNEATK